MNRYRTIISYLISFFAFPIFFGFICAIVYHLDSDDIGQFVGFMGYFLTLPTNLIVDPMLDNTPLYHAYHYYTIGISGTLQYGTVFSLVNFIIQYFIKRKKQKADNSNSLF